ncbi:hypothetical protein BCR42DRAFT_406209 [Absidia repens]|uniref:Charged multivesicular body protein 1a n=1 Tax=Absidia repens TaxID=90262 RepID=A0A1X2IUI8_9FUNG|nr:hypothetical protein BCR42DRAFT_406209 [Absidia repens]
MGGLENQLFQLKFTSKQLQKQSKRCQKEEQLERTKVKKALEKGQTEAAHIYAENCICKKNESLTLLKLSSRVDGVASRVQTAMTMKAVSSSMASVVKNMEKSMASMDIEKMAGVLDKFETQVESLNLQEERLTSTEPLGSQVDQLLQQMIEDENASTDLSQLDQLNQLQVPSNNLHINASKSTASPKDTNDSILEKRLQALRG